MRAVPGGKPSDELRFNRDFVSKTTFVGENVQYVMRLTEVHHINSTPRAESSEIQID